MEHDLAHYVALGQAVKAEAGDVAGLTRALLADLVRLGHVDFQERTDADIAARVLNEAVATQNEIEAVGASLRFLVDDMLKIATSVVDGRNVVVPTGMVD
jgi:hypothetical protein